MTYTETLIKVPERMAEYLQPATEEDEMLRNAMILLPYIQKGEISHGRAAEIIGIEKWELIKKYDELGLPYLSSISNYEADLQTVTELMEKI